MNLDDFCTRLTVPPQHVINVLENHLTYARAEKIDEVLLHRFMHIHIAIESPADILNALAVVRSSDALGACHVHIINSEIQHRQAKRTSVGSVHWVNLREFDHLNTFLTYAREKSLFLAGATLNGTAAIEDLPSDRPICLFLGNESRGLSTEAIKNCDLTYSLPMYGMVECYNLSVAAALSLYQVVQKRKIAMRQNSDMNPQETLFLKAWYYMKSIGFEKGRIIVETHLNHKKLF